MLIRWRRNREGRAHTVIQVSPLSLCFNHKVALVFVSLLFERVKTVVHCGFSNQTNVTEISASSEPSRLSFFINMGLLLTLGKYIKEIQSATYLSFFFHVPVVKQIKLSECMGVDKQIICVPAESTQNTTTSALALWLKSIQKIEDRKQNAIGCVLFTQISNLSLLSFSCNENQIFCGAVASNAHQIANRSSLWLCYLTHVGGCTFSR